MAERITHDKPFDLKGEVNARMVSNIDEMLGQLYWSIAQLENKLSNNEGLLKDNGLGDTGLNINLTQWKKGPWTFDEVDAGDTFNAPGVAVVNNNYNSGTTLNDYDPPGLETAVALELGGIGSSSITITGIKQHTPIRRILGVINRDTSTSITLKHESSSSSPKNRFDLPNDVDVVLAAGQALWLYYSLYRDRWIPFITPHSSGGLATMGIDGLAVVTRSLTELELESLFTTPITLVAAAGASKTIYPICGLVEVTVTTGYSTSPTFELIHAGDAATELIQFTNFSWVATGIKSAFAMGATHVRNPYGTFDPRNKDLQISLSADPGTPGTGVATGTVTVYYTTITTT